MDDEQGNISLPMKMLLAAVKCDPMALDVGILLSDPDPEIYEHPLVLWFKSSAAFSDFLVEAVPKLFCGEGDLSELMESLSPLARVLREEGITQGLLDEVNDYLRQWLKMEWLGTFTDLCAADTELTRTVVEWFRVQQGDEGGAAIIAEEAEDFAEYLASLADQ